MSIVDNLYDERETCSGRWTREEKRCRDRGRGVTLKWRGHDFLQIVRKSVTKRLAAERNANSPSILSRSEKSFPFRRGRFVNNRALNRFERANVS